MNYEAIEIAPCVFIFENIIDNSEEIISCALEKSKEQGIHSAKIIDSKNDMVENTNIRDTLSINIEPLYKNDVMWWLIAQKIWQYGNEYANYHGISFSVMEYPQFLYYPKNKGFYSTHIDGGFSNVPRIFSAVLYLNDVEVGGETYFDKLDISVKPIAGRLLMFPSNFVYSHGAKIPESNDKYCIVNWFLS